MLSLSLMLMMLVLGMAFLYRRQAQYRAAQAAPWQAQARALSQAGLEDCRVKWQKDPIFPPRSSEDQLYFNYTESLKDDGGAVVGNFAVTVDFRMAGPPYKVARVTSVGILLADGKTVAEHKIMAEFDLSDVLRGTTDPNPKYFQYINWKDLGNL